MKKSFPLATATFFIIVLIMLAKPPHAGASWSPLTPTSLYQVSIKEALSFRPQGSAAEPNHEHPPKLVAQAGPSNSSPRPGLQTNPEKINPSASQSPVPQPPLANELVKNYKEWQLKCFGSPVQRCELSQQRHDQNTKQLLYWVELSRGVNDNTVVMTVVAPLGIAVKDGMAVSVDGTKIIQASILSCLPVGCMSRIVLDQTVLDRLSQGRILSTSAALVNGQPLNLGMPLDGFSDGFIALSQMLRQQRRR